MMALVATIARRLRLSSGSRIGTLSIGVGAGLRIDPSTSNPDYATGANELPVQQALAQYLSPGAVFYDVGANIGFLTIIGARLVEPHGRVYAFEPVPQFQLGSSVSRCRLVPSPTEHHQRGHHWSCKVAGVRPPITPVGSPGSTVWARSVWVYPRVAAYAIVCRLALLAIDRLLTSRLARAS